MARTPAKTPPRHPRRQSAPAKPLEKSRGDRPAPTTVLNARPVDPTALRILIVSPPKTGNTWLRLLLRHAYGLRNVDLPVPFAAEAATALGAGWISHTHLLPHPELVDWLVAHDVTVLTTVRHPGDTLASLFHYLRWAGDPGDPACEMLRGDGDRPGAGAERYARAYYAQTYSIAHAWATLGSHVVRYEDLIADPLEELRAIADRIGPVAEPLLRRAVILGDPRLMRSLGEVDPRHVRKAEPGGWREDLPAGIVDFLRANEPFTAACARWGYGWSATADAAERRRFDYGAISPFAGTTTFANGDPIGSVLVRIHLDAPAKHPDAWGGDPLGTGPGTFWAWLMAPADAASNDRFPPATLTNLMGALWDIRTDLAHEFPDPWGDDRLRFALWFVERAQIEFGISWRMVEPVLQAALEHMGAARVAARGGRRRPAASAPTTRGHSHP